MHRRRNCTNSKIKKIVLDEDIVSNWNYFLTFPKDKEHILVNDIIENELRIYKSFYCKNYQKTKTYTMKILTILRVL